MEEAAEALDEAEREANGGVLFRVVRLVSSPWTSLTSLGMERAQGGHDHIVCSCAAEWRVGLTAERERRDDVLGHHPLFGVERLPSSFRHLLAAFDVERGERRKAAHYAPPADGPQERLRPVPYDAAVTKGVVRAKDKINLPPSARAALDQQVSRHNTVTLRPPNPLSLTQLSSVSVFLSQSSLSPSLSLCRLAHRPHSLTAFTSPEAPHSRGLGRSTPGGDFFRLHNQTKSKLSPN